MVVIVKRYIFTLFTIVLLKSLGFKCLFHSELTDNDRIELQQLVDIYILPLSIGKQNVLVELKMWKLKLASSYENIIKYGLEVLQDCNRHISIS